MRIDNVVYLGPKATFAEQAALCFFEEKYIKPVNSIYEAIMSVEKNDAEFCVVPMENSVGGIVNDTLDTLICDVSLNIVAEMSLPISQCLLVKNTNKEIKIDSIISHPQAFAQCRYFLQSNYQGCNLISSSSTSEAARFVSESPQDNMAAIATEYAAKEYGLNILNHLIQDNVKNETKFIVISKSNENRFEEMKDQSNKLVFNERKTSILLSAENKPGSLFKILSIFALWDINMTKIVSRPMADSIGEYVFLIDIDGDIENEDTKEAMRMINKNTTYLKILGTYNNFIIRK